MIPFLGTPLKTPHRRRAFPALPLACALASACAVSQQQEVQIGADYAAQVEQKLPLVRDPEIATYINVLGDSLARVVDDRSLTWHFAVVDSRELNAFALPGGYIFINRGIIERAASLSQVAGVLGHEIGHVTRRHSIKQMQKAQGMNVGMMLGCVLTNVCSSPAAQSGLIDLAAAGVFAKFSRDDEAEADAEGVKTLVRAGIDPNGIPEMFRILLDERKARPQGVETFFLSHPLEEDRIAATRQMLAQYAPDILRGLTRDSPNFQAFKRRLTALPAPPPPARKP